MLIQFQIQCATVSNSDFYLAIKWSYIVLSVDS